MKKMMQAIQVPAPGAPFVLASLPVPEPSTDEVLIKVEACGICHGDALALEGNYPGLTYPVIPGHEVIGTIVEMGSLAASFWRSGQRVGVGWHGGHCGQCASCRRGDFWHCEHVRTTGLSRNGGYAEYLVAPSNVLVEIPAGIPSREGAPLLCAGNTVYAALKKSGAQGGDLVGIVGPGGARTSDGSNCKEPWLQDRRPDPRKGEGRPGKTLGGPPRHRYRRGGRRL